MVGDREGEELPLRWANCVVELPIKTNRKEYQN